MGANVLWEVDDRPATLYARLYVAGMRLRRDKQAFEGAQHTLDLARRLQEKGDRPPTPVTRFRCRVRTERVAGMTVWSAGPRRREPTARVLYVHGGGYVHPLTADYWRLVRALTSAPAEVVVPAYPLAPGATVDDVLPRLLRLAEELGRRDDQPLTLMGDSAGGALVVVLARILADDGHAPARVVSLCPWLDARLAEEEVADLEATDPMLAESGLRAAGRWWAGERDPADPLVSPVAAELGGLPELHVWIGDRDILRPAVDRLASRAEQQGAQLHVHEVSAMFHVWMTRLLPEARRTRRRLVALLRESPL